MPYVLIVEIATEGAPAPTRSEITFELPGGGTDSEAATVARGIYRGFRDAFDVRVKIIDLQRVGLSRDVDLGEDQPEKAPPARPGPDLRVTP